ncbi:MAG: TIGR03364 family FAD-dependent oxidoreductase [Caulobacteraceae bacterium]|nr:TIGR03364 family FAD-dependent oxidoreductase [Caulobacteraceae bacterium]
MRSEPEFDLAVVGAGIVGLACALAAVQRGKKVVVIDRDAQANGASVRNFGFITVTGQARGYMWGWAHRSRLIWEDIAEKAGIPILHRGLLMTARRPESLAVIEAFLKTEMGEGCALLAPAEALARQPGLAGGHLLGALWSPHELRVESREAIPKLAQWLEHHHGVTFRRGEAALSIEPGQVMTSKGLVEAQAIAVCPGDDLYSLFPEQIAARGVRRCKLQMLRLADPGFRLQGGVMSDLGLERYEGYGALPEAEPLRMRLQQEQPDHLANGVHLIVVQSADGSLVVGDSHHYAPTPDPFASEAVDRLILEEFAAVFGAVPPVLERWTGTYAHVPGKPVLIETPMPGVRLVMVTTGAGASTGFALGEHVVEELFEGAQR